jgi:putative phosphoribosyl transferase
MGRGAPRDLPVGRVAEGGVAGVLALPPRTRGVVVLAGHGSRAVADVLAEAGFGTLLLDPITPDEEPEDSVARAIDWLDADAIVGDLPPRLRHLPIGCFGASTGAAAALIAAAERPHRVGAAVAHGGPPDLARDVLSRVTVPILLIAGAEDPERVPELTREWFERRL